MNIIYIQRFATRYLVVGLLFGLLGSNFGSYSALTTHAAPHVHGSLRSEPYDLLCDPVLTFTSVPPFGRLTGTTLSGRVDCIKPEDYKVVIYINPAGWWVKPNFTHPLTTIIPDSTSSGTWSLNIRTGGVDELATQIAAFVVPNNTDLAAEGLLLAGSPDLPDKLFDISVAHLIQDRYRTIEFSERIWNVKAGESKIGPGPNYFSAGESDVWVDGSGNLHLTITYRNGKWYCTEVFTQASLGYGSYSTVLASPIDQLDANAVLGIFTWDDNAPEYNYREIDIEFSRWGDSLADNSQYVVQPYYRAGNTHRFDSTLSGIFSTHRFQWESDQVLFSSHQGNEPNLGIEIDSWSYTGTDIPPEGDSHARINLWLYNGTPPADGQEIEVVIKSFIYTPNHNVDTTGVFRPSNGVIFLKNTNTTGFADIALNYGLGGDYPVTGDWDGNGTDTIGVYRNGSFYLRNVNTIGFANLVFPFGTPGDQPIAGDWDGDGIDTIGVYRPSTGQFLLRNSNSAGGAHMSFYLGNVGDVGIAGDWDGDGMDTTGVFRPSNGVIFLKNTNSTGFADIALNYGLPGDQPVTGDWDNDGKDTIGVYRNGQFLLRNSNTVGFADIVFGLGNPGDMPIAGDWDGMP